MKKAKHEWYQRTWNPVTGCFHHCEYCLPKIRMETSFGRWDAESRKKRAGDNNLHVVDKPMIRHTSGKNRDIGTHDVIAPFPYGFDPTFHRYRLDYPEKRKVPACSVLVASKGDLFGDWVPDEWIEEIFEACAKAPEHKYFFLTKNPKRYIRLAANDKLPANHMYGFSINREENRISENILFSEQLYSNFRMFALLDVLYIMPSLDFLRWDNLKWVILEDKYGDKWNLQKHEQLNNIVDMCKSMGIPVFMKNNLASIWGLSLMKEYPVW